MKLAFTTHVPSSIKYIVGIDEVGRGPLAGPVAVGAVIFPVQASGQSLAGYFSGKVHASKSASLGSKIPEAFLRARDSKQLTPIAREIWFEKIRAARLEGVLDFKVSFVSHDVIDKKGIMYALRKAIYRTLHRLSADPSQTLVLLDGGIRAPDHFLFQKTIFGGDRKEPIISLASIAAKVMRDRKMWKLAENFPEFGFEMHKGYGTRYHIKKLEKYGPCEIHRKSFLQNFLSADGKTKNTQI